MAAANKWFCKSGWTLPANLNTLLAAFAKPQGVGCNCKKMRVLKQTLYLSAISIVIHTIIKFLLPKLIEWPAIEQIRYITVIIAMTLFIVLSYFLIKKWDKKKPAFLKCLAITIISQTLSILSWTLSGAFDMEDFLWKTFLFAFLLPLLLLTIVFVTQGRSEALLPSDLPEF